MTKHFLRFILAAVLSAFFLRDARAETPRARTVFALIVTSNHGVSGAQPDLHYADDDGVKYLELFRTLAPEENVVLHTELDRDTERLYPWARALARPPTKGAVLATVADFAERVRTVTRAGGDAELYFVFAGHGDVDAGEGFLELEDARFTSEDMESMLRSVAATRSHVILDSCNSFFVMNARKPGGRRIATTADDARSLGERLPNVGVFLSTSAEAEVFEWSELQAGVFSHTVRSGLAGAADADGDGEVTYAELRSFVDVASARIKNPLYRPKVFARGPGANGGEALVHLSGARGTVVRIDGPETRLTFRDADDVPLVDLHKEDGASVTIHLPERWASHGAAEEHDPAEPSRVRKRFVLGPAPSAQPIVLAELTPTPPAGEPRGASEVFRTLFAMPFGPRAMADAADEVRTEDASAVFGVSEDEVVRLHTLLAQAAGDARGRRLTLGTGFVAFGAVTGAAGGWLVGRGESSSPVSPYVLLGYGGLLTTLGGVSLFLPSGEERLFERYAEASRVQDPALRARAVLDAERDLFALARSARRRRTWERVAAVTLAGVAAGLFAINEYNGAQKPQSCSGGDPNAIVIGCSQPAPVSSDALWAGRLTYGSLFALGATLTVSSFVPRDVERLADIWESDPGRVRGPDSLPSVAIAPRAGGAELQLSWRF